MPQVRFQAAGKDSNISEVSLSRIYHAWVDIDQSLTR